MSATAAAATSSATDAVSQGAGIGQNNRNQSINTFAASLATASIVFGAQIVAFLLLSGNWKIRNRRNNPALPSPGQSLFQKIYYYKTAFVPKRKRIATPVTAIESFKNVFTISDRELLRVAGTDGYLFLQYLQLLLRIFIPMAFVILPILLPINRVGDVPGVSGLDSFAWPNVGVPAKSRRLWAHCILAVVVVFWVSYNFYLALRKFVRLRQTILTLPEHRIRASATTILVQSIPRKWLTVAALDALYDVFPGGIREVWINRDYDDLNEKVNMRTKIARALEEAETNLILECNKAHKERLEKEAKQSGQKKTKQEKKADEEKANDAVAHDTMQQGTSVNNPHQIEQTLQDVLVQDGASGSSSSSRSRSSSRDRKHRILPIPIVGQGVQIVGDGIRDVGKLGGRMVGGLRGALGRHDRSHDRTASDAADHAVTESPETGAFEPRGSSSDTNAPLYETKTGKESLEHSHSSQSSPGAAKKEHLTTTQSALNPLQDSIQALRKSPLNLNRKLGDFASPQPFRAEGEEFPLETKHDEPVKYDMNGIYDAALLEDDETALWRQYIKPTDRETMRIPIFNKSWWPSIPLIGKKVDTIYYCRKELARLNHEIAIDQSEPERFPLMNSAFIQFNHQVGAHMACQSVSYHIPRQMSPRTVEVNPNEVIWDNLTMAWWSRYLRMALVIIAIVGLVVLWGIPVSFTGALSQIKQLSTQFHWLAWLQKLPTWLLSFIQGVLPPAFLAILFFILPLLLRFLADLTGTTTAGERELLVQNFYFAFVFVQLFLVVSISTGITSTIKTLLNDPISVPQTLAQNLPKAANYFFSYMILQALSISSGTLLQVMAVVFLLLSRFLDTTPRQKVTRVLSRSDINWGNMIPVYTNFGAIGLIYSVVAPLIMIMMLITFSLFWFTYRYQMIYVSYAKAETNGLIFPKAINQLFTGLYFLELCLVGLFFLQRDEKGDSACIPQAIIMIVMLGITVLYQFLLNRAFGPLFTYLPITFEDEAVERDAEFEKIQAARWKQDEDDERRSLNAELEHKERAEKRESEMLEADDQRRTQAAAAETYEMSPMSSNSQPRVQRESSAPLSRSPERKRKDHWANRNRDGSRNRSRSHSHHHDPSRPREHTHQHSASKRVNPLDTVTKVFKTGLDDAARPIRDIEAQVLPSANLFDDIDDQLEDIEPEARQKLIKRSFQHPATRAIQPAVWVPHDELGIATDEIGRTAAFSRKIWMTSVNAWVGPSGKVMYKGLPPDRDPFENMEI